MAATGARRRVRFPVTAVFLDAAATGDAALVQRCLDDGAPPAYANEAGTTALHLAVATRRADIVELLLRAGADPNAINDILCSPLHIAADVGDRRICELLLAAGADASLQNEDGDVPADVASDPDLEALLISALAPDALAAWAQRRTAPAMGSATTTEGTDTGPAVNVNDTSADVAHVPPAAGWSWMPVALAGVAAGVVLLFSGWSRLRSSTPLGDLWAHLHSTAASPSPSPPAPPPRR